MEALVKGDIINQGQTHFDSRKNGKMGKMGTVKKNFSNFYNYERSMKLTK
jgi:hypothetical protein